MCVCVSVCVCVRVSRVRMLHVRVDALAGGVGARIKRSLLDA